MPKQTSFIERARADDPTGVTSLSVQDRATDTAERSAPVVFFIAQNADEAPPLGPKNWPKRDKYLAEFWPKEPLLAGAIYSMGSKIAGLEWSITGPQRNVKYYRQMLRNADFGSGWATFILKWMRDLLVMDNGAFMEILRPKGAGPKSMPTGIAHLDSLKCERTGDPETPVLYHSERDNKVHPLKWWQVIATTDMPSPREEEHEMGISAVSRALRAAQILRDIALFKRQKIGGKRVPGIIFAQGIRQGVVQDAIQEAMEEQRAEGLSHYTKPIVIASHDPGIQLNTELIELAGLPDGYDEDITLQWYVAQLAIDFGVDYGEFAPLPGKGLGTASQVESMEERARGKGPRIVARLIEHAINYYILPESTTFSLMTPDPGSERLDSELAQSRAETRATRITSGEITPAEARELAALAGDLPREYLRSGESTGEGELSARTDIEVGGEMYGKSES